MTEDMLPRAASHTLPIDRTKDMSKRARTFLTERLADLPPDVAGNILLLTSELVTNAVVHGETPAHLDLGVDEHTVRVLVHDSGPGTPATPTVGPDELPSSGRGLIIVAALARSWGVVELGDGLGKDVWFEMGAS